MLQYLFIFVEGENETNTYPKESIQEGRRKIVVT